MDITLTNTNAANAKSPETESTDHPKETTRIQSAKHLTISNGVLKRHQPHHQLRHYHHHHHHHHPIVVSYKECLRNHAASMGGHALDGCGEFMQSPTATATDPTSLKCAACGCHRNFHRREPEDIINTASLSNPTNANTTATIQYQPHHRHHPPPPPPVQQNQPQPPSQRSPNSSSPPPISSSYYPSAPHMLLALSGNLQSAQDTMINNLNVNVSSNSSPRKRFRTKFSQSQKDKMFQFAERVGWKMQKRDDEMVQEFCNEVGVDRTVLKVWMHNNKNTHVKRDLNGNDGGGGEGEGGRINLDNHSNEENNSNNSNDDNRINKNGSDDHEDNINSICNNNTMQNLNHHYEIESVARVATANGSSSSS